MILRMVIKCIILIIDIIPSRCIPIILNMCVMQDGSNRLALRQFTSLTTKSLFFVSFPSSISWANFRLCQLVTQEQFRTTFATSFRARPVTAGQVPAMNARYGLSTLGPWAGPVICNEWNGSTQHGGMFRQQDHAALRLYYIDYRYYFTILHINNANNEK